MTLNPFVPPATPPEPSAEEQFVALAQRVADLTRLLSAIVGAQGGGMALPCALVDAVPADSALRVVQVTAPNGSEMLAMELVRVDANGVTGRVTLRPAGSSVQIPGGPNEARSQGGLILLRD